MDLKPSQSVVRLQRRVANRIGDLVALEQQEYANGLSEYLINGLQERIREGHVDAVYLRQHTAKILGDLRELFHKNNDPWTREVVDALTENLPFDHEVARTFRLADH